MKNQLTGTVPPLDAHHSEGVILLVHHVKSQAIGNMTRTKWYNQNIIPESSSTVTIGRKKHPIYHDNIAKESIITWLNLMNQKEKTVITGRMKGTSER